MKKNVGIYLALALLMTVAFDARAILSFTASAKAYTTEGTSGTYQPRASDGLVSVLSYEAEHEVANLFQAVARAASYGSDKSTDDLSGVEPMADTQASVRIDAQTGLPLSVTAVAAASATITHRVQPKPGVNADDVMNMAVPLMLSYALSTNVDDFANAQAGFSITGPDVPQNNSQSVSNGEDKAGTIAFTAIYDQILDYVIGVTAGTSAYYGAKSSGGTLSIVGGSGQAVADPFLFIDPAWEHVGLFQVLQESYEHPGTWIEVTRSWRQTGVAPEPSIVLLVLVGLGVAGIRSRKRMAA